MPIRPAPPLTLLFLPASALAAIALTAAAIGRLTLYSDGCAKTSRPA